MFDNVHFKGKGHEVKNKLQTINCYSFIFLFGTFFFNQTSVCLYQAADLRLLMQKMENWAHRLYPKLQFEDFIDKVEKLGAKKEVQVG